jgi:hypothetical protein
LRHELEGGGGGDGGGRALLPGESPETPWHDDGDHWIGVNPELLATEASRVLAIGTRTGAAQLVDSNQSLVTQLKEVVGRGRGRDNP